MTTAMMCTSVLCLELTKDAVQNMCMVQCWSHDVKLSVYENDGCWGGGYGSIWADWG